ncbi:FadR/GntR family transcriptional regulator [Actinomycetospora straminea]|uniref:FadR/GntR family transcriptional regulator n=1 Tax=Actinomycetospora straminea TaxID=663607 RepID=UPI002365482B|nr:FadR/GntR family transcriptional regulator [Actinomycetospora straminea]MDD7931567.1 FadR/GntR family transcriptional regulator [Actinomycetospora straminea]
MEQVIDALSAPIERGDWPPGHRLPAVTDLAAELEVGRSTVREAVQALAHHGLLEVAQGRGTFVATPRSGEDAWSLRLARSAARDVYEARRGPEIEAARLAALRRTDDDLLVIEAAAADRRKARTCGATGEWAEADLALHRAVVAATHNPVLARVFDALAEGVHDTFTQQSADPGSGVDTAREHDALVAAIARQDPDAAAAATRGYLDACEQELRSLLGETPR